MTWFARAHSLALRGLEADAVTLELSRANGLPSFQVVGLADLSVKESVARVRSACEHAGYELASSKVTVNLAPATFRKEGAIFDLPLALALLATHGWLAPEALDGFISAGELSLDGTLRPVRGALTLARAAAGRAKPLILPRENLREAALVPRGCVYGARSLVDIVRFLNGEGSLPQAAGEPNPVLEAPAEHPLDLADVKGQRFAKRALEVACAGHHPILLIGPPGCGKTLLAERMPSLLPVLSFEQALEVTEIYSAAGLLTREHSIVLVPPFRGPHASLSVAGLVGGGPRVRPGEISLAHRGVLLLDEFPEFRREALEALRGPMESGVVTIARAGDHVTFPARFLLAATMNPCPCGFRGANVRRCRCSSTDLHRYYAKLSGPILDRIDLQIEVPALPLDDVRATSSTESSRAVRERILRARECAGKRLAPLGFHANGEIPAGQVEKLIKLSADASRLLDRALAQLQWSARGHHKILKVARTLADLAGSEDVAAEHLAEAIHYRSLDRLWN